MGISTTIPLGKLFCFNSQLLSSFFPMLYSQSDLSLSLVSLHYSHSNKSLACGSITNEELFFPNTSVTHNQKFTKLKIRTLLFFLHKKLL